MTIDEVGGRQVADYRIESVLGRGGQGVVYLAEHVHLGRKVALKLLVPEMAADPDFRRRFVRESQIAASLDHPNILAVYDGGQADGELYVAVRLVGGSDLAAILDEHDHLPPERALDILEPVARALDFAHAHGMVHRDVKPGNVLIEPPTPERDHEQVFLCDFGLTKSVRVTDAGATPLPSGSAPTQPAGAAPTPTQPAGAGPTAPAGPGQSASAGRGLTEPAGPALTQHGYFVGTPQYAAPEQVRGEALTGAADQYALACVLFECLTGKLPFSRDSIALLLMAHAMDEPPPVRSMRTELPVGLDQVLARGLAKEPSARYPSCSALVEAARAALRETAKLFISYARQDKSFVEWLHGRLADRGRNSWVDWEGIPPSALWMAEIRAAIDSADAFVFVISPHSTESGSCREELAHAEASNKRIIPIMYEEVDRALLPTALAVRNWVFLRPDDDVSAGMASLLEAIDVDPEWVGTHTRLLTRAREWAADGKKSSHCLRGAQLKDAEEWLENARGREPSPARLHTEFILASRRHAARRQRGGLTAVAVAFLAVVVLAGVAFVQRQSADHERSIAERQRAIAERQRAEATRQRDRAVQQSRLALSGGLAAKTVSLLDSRLDVGLLLGLEALRAAPTLDARSALLLGAQRSDEVIRYLHGGGEEVHSVSISPDGTTLASGGEDGTLILWDMASFQPLGAPLRGHTDEVMSVAFSPDGKMLASGSMDSTVILWDVAAHRQVGEPLRGHSDLVSSVAFSPDGKTLASGSADGTVILWDVAGHRRIGDPLRGHKRAVTSVAFSPDGKMLASGSMDRTVILWDVAAHRQVGEPLRGHKDVVAAVAFSPDGTTLASASFDRTIALWNITTHRRVGASLRGHRSLVLSLAFSPDGATLASGSDDDTLILWDVATRRRIGAPLRGLTDSIVSVAFTPDGRTVASGSLDGTVVLWDVAAHREAGIPLRGHEGSVFSVAFSPDGTTLATGGLDGSVVLWDVATRTQIGTLLRGHEDPVFGLAFSPDGETLASGSIDGTVVLWDVATRRPVGAALQGGQGAVTRVAFNPDGTILAAAGADRTVILWDVAGRRRIGALRGHTDGVLSVAFSPDGTKLATGSDDLTVILWDVATRRRIGTLRGHDDSVFGVAFSPDGATLASASFDHAVILWDVATLRQIGTDLRGHTNRVSSVVFASGGTTLASAGADGAVILWDVATRRRIGGPLLGHAGTVFSLAVSPDGRTMASGNEDGTAILWPSLLWSVDPSVDLEAICGRVGRNLTQDEWNEFVPGEPYHATCPRFPAGS